MLTKVSYKIARILGVTFALGAGILLYSLTTDIPLTLFPQNQTYFEFVSMVDADIAEGNSIAKIDSSDNRLELSYRLGNEGKKPFAMMVFHDYDLVRNYDITGYDSLHFHVSDEHTADFSVTLYMYIPGFSDPALTDTHRPYRFDIRMSKRSNEFSVALKDFATPGWWFTKFNTTDEKLPETDWSKFTHMTISSFENDTNRKPQRISFEEISFRRSHLQPFLLSLTLFLVLSYMALRFFLPNKPLKIFVPQQLIRPFSRSTNPEAEEQLLFYITDNYQNPLLSLDLIKKEIGLNHFQVQQILQESHNLNYKEYLKQMRMNKAKELLASTNLPVKVIAEQVGYVYANSFSRTFKLANGMTPQEFRKSRS